jgi:glycosyltransferase involved in cell wall biosynthesis
LYFKIPKISIITVTLNSEKTLERSIKSILKLNYKKKQIEFIIIDGGSTDNTLNIINKYKKHIHFFLSEKDLGMYFAINKGLKHCTGDIIGILNSDDYFYKNALVIVGKYFKKFNIDYLFGTVKKAKIHQGFHKNKIWYKFDIYPSHSVGFFIKRTTQKKLGSYNTKFKYSADRDLLYKLITNDKFIGMATKKTEVIGKFSPNGMSSKISFFKKMLEESKIRVSNNQNFYIVYLLLITRLSYYFARKFIKKTKLYYF